MLSILLVLGCALSAQGDVSTTRFIQEIPSFFTVADGLPSDEVRALAILADGRVLAATGKGLAVFDGTKWASDFPSPAFDVLSLQVSAGRVWAGGDGRLAVFDNGAWTNRALPEGCGPVLLCAQGEGVVAATLKGLWRETPDRHELVAELEHPLSLAALGDTDLAVGTDKGLYRVRDGATPMYPADARYSWAPRAVKALVAPNGALWFGADNGAGMLKDDAWTLYTGKEGLPYTQFTCATAGPSGEVWFGTERGALRHNADGWAYRASRRWLPDDLVNAIAVAADGTAWFATPKGLARIERKSMTLAEKAKHYEDIIEQRHIRMGFVRHAQLAREGDVSEVKLQASDNDGLYTSFYGAAQAFRYAATRDPEAKRIATRTFEALKLLSDVTSIPGFAARAVVPADGSEPDPNRVFNAAYNAGEKARDPLWKDILPRWPKSADGKYWWKCDTSSDEICGHFFFYAAYFDLVAETDAERAPVIAVVRAMADHIVDHGFKLVDHDGLPTRWANWSPEYTNTLEGWADRGVQAVEILSFLNVAEHVTGDAKYAEAAKRLRDRHAYHITAMDGRAVFPPSNVVPWDNNLAFLSYYGLLKYERDAELRAVYQASIRRNWLFVSQQNDPFFTFVYATTGAADTPSVEAGYVPTLSEALTKATRTLRGAPWSFIGWQIANSHRLDVTQDPAPGQRKAYGRSTVTGEALPIEERCHIRINSDHFFLDHAQGGGRCEWEGTYYLLPYYMGLYHSLLR